MAKPIGSTMRVPPLLKLVLRRLIALPISIFVVISLAVVLIDLMPGDPALLVAGQTAPPEQLAEVREALELDKSLVGRYQSYLSGLVRGDLGESFITGRPVKTELLEHLPSTLELIIPSLLLACVIGLVVGGLAAYAQVGPVGRLSRLTITAVQSIPDFFLALVLIYVLFFLAGVAPSPVGRLGLTQRPPQDVTGLLVIDSILARDGSALVAALRHLMLPVLSLGIVYSAYFAKTTRSCLRVALASQQVEFARASGLSELQVLRYAFLAARTPIITYGAMLFGTLVGGAAIVETIFSWGGLGEWALNAVLNLDIPAMQGFILVAGVITLLVYLVLDVVVKVLDPRVSYD